MAVSMATGADEYDGVVPLFTVDSTHCWYTGSVRVILAKGVV